ncbi:MAG: ATP-binding protein [Bacteroidota bacterium]|nr:ATP-binding protein [Bacteroidota bacterium]MDP4231157.1 ATP-binding protein [Bacteroidota bacterium]MDP4236086.1 ATP-binding protein [Bacteroidota bacterium]
MLRIRLVLWYSFLVVLTVAAVGAVQYALLYRSLANELDSDLLDDAKTALHLVSNRASKHFSPGIGHTHTNYSSKTIKQLVDDAIRDAPDSISGKDLTDRVLSSLMDEMLGELSSKDSIAADPFDALVERTLTSRRNDLMEIYAVRPESGMQKIGLPIYRTQNLGSDTIRNLYSISAISAKDTARTLGEVEFKGEALRAAIASNKDFIVFEAYTETDIWDVISRSQSTYLFVLPIALLIATFGGIILARKALKPIEEIANTAQDIGAKNLSRRIEMPARGDRELTSLVSTLNSMISRIEGSFNQIAQFSSDASHELKTPLAILKGEIEQAQRRIESIHHLETVEAQTLLASLMEEVERMQRIVEGLLLLAKADDHKLPLRKENVLLSRFLESIAEDAEILAADRGLHFQRQFDENAKEIRLEADPTFLYQVLMNLLDNAFKYTPSGGMVRLFLHRSDGMAKFGVEDTGSGISPEDLKKIFRRFYRSEQARAHQGAEHTGRSLGLGLAITKSIVEAHGGNITVESQVGKGSKFTVGLPILKG